MLSQLVYANLTTQDAAASPTSAGFTFPAFTVGKQYLFATRFLQEISGTLSEVFPTIRALRATIGNVDARPAGGSVKLQVGAGEQTEGNTTAAISWNASGDAMAQRLGALPDFAAAGFKVDSDNGSYLIRRANGAQVTITPRENKLRPVSFVQIRSRQDAEGWVTEVRFVQSPIAFTDTSDPKLPKKPYFKAVADGVDYGNGVAQNEVQHLVIPPQFRGEFYVVYKKDGEAVPRRTQLFSLSDGVEEYKAALDAVMEPDGGIAIVTNPSTGIARFEFAGDLAGADIPLMAVEVPEEGAPPGDQSFLLDFNTFECWAALRGLPEVEIPFELEIDVPEDEEDDESATKTLPVWNKSIKIKRSLNSDGLATAQPVNWLRKPNPKTYLPYNTTQIGIGQAYYEHPEALGDGEATEFEIDHNLGTAALAGVCIYELDTGRILRDSEYSLLSTNAGNTLQITFEAAPAAGNIGFVLAAPQSIEWFVNDLEIQIAQVDGLAAILEDLSERVGVLEEILPSTGPGVTTATSGAISILLPKTKEILFTPIADGVLSEKGIDETKLLPQRRPYMLPAVHDAAADNVTAIPASPTGNAGKVYKNNDAPTLIVAAGGFTGSAAVKQNEFFACDGRSFYKVTRSSASNSYYPTAFERTLFAVVLNEKQMRVGRTLDASLGLQLQLIKADSFAQWVFSMELGTAPQDDSPNPVGLNLQNVIWSDTPIFEHRIIVDPLLQTHTFGVRIRRLSGGFELDQNIYGWEGNNAAAPATANFALRARLTRFDLENAPVLPRGYVFYALTAGLDAAGKASTEDAKIVIS